MDRLKQWSETSTHFAALGSYQGWSKVSPDGAVQALRQVLIVHDEGHLVSLLNGECHERA